MRLRHIHVPHVIPYAHSLRLQEAIVAKHLADKDALRKDASIKSQAPPPTLLTFRSEPTYTVGRRHLLNNPLRSSQIAYLTGKSNDASHTSEDNDEHGQQLATFFPSPRGGLLTYHAPGQLTAYLILNLRTHNLTPRCYIRMLEDAVIRTCREQNVPNVMTTDDPGVWIAENPQAGSEQQNEDVPIIYNTPTTRKVCAIGVHISRGITSHGIGLNVFDPYIAPDMRHLYKLPTKVNDGEQPFDSTSSAPGYLSWGFSRIVACGLEGKTVTWLTQEVSSTRKWPINLKHVANCLAAEVAKGLNIPETEVENKYEEDVLEDIPRSWAFLRSQNDGQSQSPDGWGNRYKYSDVRQDTGMRFLA